MNTAALHSDLYMLLLIYLHTPVIFDNDAPLSTHLHHRDIRNEFFRNRRLLADFFGNILFQIIHLPETFYAHGDLSFLLVHIFNGVNAVKRKYLIKILILFGLFGLIVYSEQSADAARNALRICGLSVIPSLFPFFVLSKLLLSGGVTVPIPNRFAEKCFGVSGDCLSAFCVSLLGGYPAGVAAVADLYKSGTITKQDAEMSICFCNNSGPAFFLSFIGSTVLHSAKLGFVLYLIHILSAGLCGRMLSGRRHAMLQIRRISSKQTTQEKRFPETISESCASLLQISGLIVFFSVMLAMAEEIGLFRLLAHIPYLPIAEVKALLCGIFELSVGILRSADSRFSFVLCSLIMGWGGFCVHMQAKALCQAAGLQPKRYLYSKLLHGLISAVFALTYALPCALSLSVCGSVFLLCVLFPTISKKWGRNLARNTL